MGIYWACRRWWWPVYHGTRRTWKLRRQKLHGSQRSGDRKHVPLETDREIRRHRPRRQQGPRRKHKVHHLLVEVHWLDPSRIYSTSPTNDENLETTSRLEKDRHLTELGKRTCCLHRLRLIPPHQEILPQVAGTTNFCGHLQILRPHRPWWPELALSLYQRKPG